MIRVLSPQVINQIAAGEVIERPFSVVKELVENSLDAGAGRITVELLDGGCQLIRVTDDGVGFAKDDLALAFVSHATSKLDCLEDLDRIASLGFRGEALASIGAVSRATVRSRQQGADGFAVDSVGTGFDVRPCGMPEGTVVEVRELFFNTPARRRFLKSVTAERARCQDLLQRLSLSRLDIGFSLDVDGRNVLQLPAGESLRDRVGRCFGNRLASHAWPVDLQGDGVSVQGLCIDPDLARRDSTLELLYVNGRNAKDRSVGFAIRQAYRDFLMGGRHPVYFLMLDLPPDQVDVNVHPTKAEVRFAESRRICGLLNQAVRRALAGRGEHQGEARSEHGLGVAVAEAADAGAGGIRVGDLPAARSGMPDLGADLFGRPVPPPAMPARRAGAAVVVDGIAPPNPFAALVSTQFLQVMDLYLVLEGQQGLIVVDQHALHERVIYERLKRRHEAQPVRIQRLLVPAVIEVTATDKAWLLDAQSKLADEGLLLADFGSQSVVVQGIPAVISRTDPERLIRALCGEDRDASGDHCYRGPSDQIAERFHSMACRAAVMAGDTLAEAEIRELLAAALTLEHPHNCPHGRPTVLTFGAAELERYFRRRI